MFGFAQDLSIVVDGILAPAGVAAADPLVRAVVISLFTWRRADPDDALPDGASRMGWWGDNHASVAGDKIGSKLWLLVREPLTDATIARAKAYAAQALDWMIADGVASRVDIAAERMGLSGLALGATIWRHDGSVRNLSFSDAWAVISALAADQDRLATTQQLSTPAADVLLDTPLPRLRAAVDGLTGLANLTLPSLMG